MQVRVLIRQLPRTWSKSLALLLLLGGSQLVNGFSFTTHNSVLNCSHAKRDPGSDTGQLQTFNSADSCPDQEDSVIGCQPFNPDKPAVIKIEGLGDDEELEVYGSMDDCGGDTSKLGSYTKKDDGKCLSPPPF